ncbi:MAG: hypothetical protein LBV43_11235 [Prevotella sp.]|jgi:hypothetical protein|nr:hypothetical protein [Prevotella sp.]
MTVQNEKFKQLLDKAVSGLNVSFNELKDRYKDYPLCLMQYIENGKTELAFDVHFDDESASIFYSFDIENNCDHSSISFVNGDDIDLFIEYLAGVGDYDFIKNYWGIGKCCLKVKELREEIRFCCHKK